MRILHVYNYHRGGGGAEIAIRTTMSIQASHGLEVQAFTRNSEDLQRNWFGRLKAGTSAFYSPDSVRDFRAVSNLFHPDIIHVYDLFPLISPAILRWCAREGIPVVMHCMHYRLTCPVATHFRDGQVCEKCDGGREYWAVLKNCRGNVAESIAVAYYTAKLRKFAKYVSRFITPSDFTRHWMIEKAGIEPERIITVLPAVAIPERPADPSKGQYVGFSGRFTPEKGIQTILSASGLCSVPFRFCRSENFLPVPLPKGIDVCITRDHESLQAFYRGARILVVPSIWFETFGMAGAEAMAHGIPVIASRIGALSELIDDNINGLHFEPGDAQDLASKVSQLWANPELCHRLGRAARQKIACWNSEHFFQSLNAVYEGVCGRSSVGDTRFAVN